MKTARMLAKLNSDRMQAYLKSLKSVKNNDGSLYYPDLDEIVKLFAPVRKLQTQLEASLEPTSSRVIPLLEMLKKRLGNLCSTSTVQKRPERVRGNKGSGSFHTQILAKKCIENLLSIQYHD